MRRYVPFLLATSLCLAVACGGDEPGAQPSASASTASPTPSPTPATLTRAQLDAVLLTAADMGSGWIGEAPEDTSDDDDSPSPGASPDPCDLDQLGDRLEDPLYGRTVNLGNEAGEIYLSHDAEVFESGAAASGFAQVNTTLASCSTLTASDPEGGDKRVTMSKQPLDVGTHGEETLSFVMTDSSGTFTVALVLFRQGDVVISLVGFSTKSSPAEAVKSATTKAVAKFQAALAGGGASTPTATATASY